MDSLRGTGSLYRDSECLPHAIRLESEAELMKVTAVEITVQRRDPNPTPIRDALQVLPGAGSVRVTVTTDDGISGRGDIYFGRIAGAPDALAAVIEHELKPVALGTDLAFIRQTHQAMLRETEYHGSFGLAMFGIAAIDTALWDALGKTRGLPCWQLWGGLRDHIPAYAMVGWLNYPDDEVQRICAKAVEQGFRAVKIKVGYPTLAEDVARVRTVRQAVGADIGIMVDANQSLTTAEAVQRGVCVHCGKPCRVDHVPPPQITIPSCGCAERAFAEKHKGEPKSSPEGR